ncbi:sugar ABC transporter permease [Streptomyces spinoverrucosus]|nr:sugar ABC transporter permease [Streptomyces spinoverrucosus]
MAPLLAVNILVIAVPATQSIWYSFTDWTGLGPADFTGLDNYRRLFGDPEFRNALWHNTLWTAFFLTVPMAMGLFGAFLLSRIKRFQMLFRVAYFIPYVVATVVSGSIWESLLSPDQGIGNGLADMGLPFLDDVNFLGDPDLALGTVAFVNTWQWWGFLVVIFLASMQAVNPSQYEAARLDGANLWQEFWHITLPAIRPTLMFLGLMTVIWSFLIFDYIYILTQGGPAGSTDVLGTLLYRTAFANQEAGYAASMGVVMGLISVIAVSGFLYLRRRGWDI